MRIKEVIEKTGLSRRTIQFYISQKLIMPKEDPVNGYHDFSDEDVRNLIIISRLRRLDFPVSDIRHILRFPGTASYYFYRQIDTLTKRMDTMRRNVDILARYFENDPAPIDCDSLAASLRLMESYEEKKLPPMILRSWTRESSLFLYGRPIFPEPAVNTRNSSGAKFPGR